MLLQPVAYAARLARLGMPISQASASRNAGSDVSLSRGFVNSPSKKGSSMNKIAIFMTILPVAFFASIFGLDCAGDESIDLGECLQRDQRVKEHSVNYYCFKRGFDSVLASLGSGVIGLRDAHARIMALASQYHPEFLAH